MACGLRKGAYRKTGKEDMRIVLIGVSHWHTRFYSDPVLGMKDATIVRGERPRRRARGATRRPGEVSLSSPNTGRCARRSSPTSCFALGRHRDMAEEARFLIESRIPFAMEKPCAVNAAEAQDIARRGRGRPRVCRRAAGDALTARSSRRFGRSPRASGSSTCRSSSWAAWSIATTSRRWSG